MTTHTIKLISLFLLIVFCVCVKSSFAQQSEETKRGIEFYNQGKDKEAIELLKTATKRNKEDIEAWHYLGLSYSRSGKKKDANRAYENAVKRGAVVFISSYIENHEKEYLKPLLLQVKAAFESAKEYLLLNQDLKESKLQDWNSRKENLEDFVKLIEGDGDKIIKASSVNSSEIPKNAKKAVVTFKPIPKHSEEALNIGDIRVQAVLGASGKVRRVIPLQKMSVELTDNIITTVKKVEFIPAQIEGRPVSQYVTLEYSFRIY